MAHSEGGWSNLIGCRGISTGVSPQAGQLLLHAEVGALANAIEGGGHRQRHQDEEHAEDGEQQELARLHPGLLHHRDLGQAAPLEDTHKQRENAPSEAVKQTTLILLVFFLYLQCVQCTTFQLEAFLNASLPTYNPYYPRGPVHTASI